MQPSALLLAAALAALTLAGCSRSDQAAPVEPEAPAEKPKRKRAPRQDAR